MRNPFRRNKKKSIGRRSEGMSYFKAGVIGIILISVLAYLTITKFKLPFIPKYTIQATFQNANGLRPGSLVRIAGVNVGQVKSVKPVTGCNTTTGFNGCSQAVVKMTVQSQGQPIHEDSTFQIRPRIFLEGNFFVDIHPGTPESPIAPSGYTFPVQQGTEPVQFDQILSALPADTRKNLQTVLIQYGQGVSKSGRSYNQSIQYWLPAYEYSAIVGHDALGIKPHDLSRWIAAQGPVVGALDAHPPNLKSLVTDFNSTAHAFAVQNQNLQQAVAELPRTLAAAIPAFNALNAAFPPVRRLARALLPGVRSSGPTIDVSLPFITQLRLLVRPSELRGLAADLAVSIPALAHLTRATIPLMKNGVRPASSCSANVIHPWSELTVPDSHFNPSNGFPTRKVYEEAVDYLPGLAGESRVFDANGPIIRVGLTGGTLTYSLAPNTFGQSIVPLGGAQPVSPKHHPPIQPNVPCETQPAISDLTAPEVKFNPIAAGNVVSGLGQSLGLPLNLLSRDKGSAKGSTSTPGQSTSQTSQTTTTGTTGTAHP